MYSIVLLIHLLAATVWTGGHLVLALRILPKALREKSPESLRQFESAYEVIGIPALLIQVVSGLWLTSRLVPDAKEWFSFGDCESGQIGLKLIFLALTAILGLDARLRIIPRLSANNLTALAWHIVPVTVLAVLFVVVGASLHNGWAC